MVLEFKYNRKKLQSTSPPYTCSLIHTWRSAIGLQCVVTRTYISNLLSIFSLHNRRLVSSITASKKMCVILSTLLQWPGGGHCCPSSMARRQTHFGCRRWWMSLYKAINIFKNWSAYILVAVHKCNWMQHLVGFDFNLSSIGTYMHSNSMHRV